MKTILSFLMILILFCSVAVSQIVDISQSQNNIQRIYQKDGSLPEIKTLLEWNNNMWENTWRSVYTYNSNDLLIEELGQGWHNNVWNDNIKVFYSYDTNNNLIEQLMQSPIGTSSLRWIHSYDSYNNRIETLFQMWTGTEWDNSGRTLFTYNPNNDLTEETIQEWDGSEWINIEKYTYSYLVTEAEHIEESVLSYDISNNYPNPFNPSTKIKYLIPAQSFVTIKVFDALGNEVKTIVNEEKAAGSYEIDFNARDLPSGIYFYRLQAGDPSAGSGQSFIETKKMVLLR